MATNTIKQKTRRLRPETPQVAALGLSKMNDLKLLSLAGFAFGYWYFYWFSFMRAGPN